MPFRELLAPLLSSKTLSYVTSVALLVGLYSCIPMWKEYSSYKDLGDMPSQFHAALSLALGSLLVFRTNSAYSRWWEARTLWGALVNAARNLSIKLACFAEPDSDDVPFLKSQIKSFPVALQEHLRTTSFSASLERSDSPPSTENQPVAIVQKIYQWIAKNRINGRIDGDELRVLDLELSKFLDICGGCERIARTPVVKSYRIFARQCILLFLLTLPWGIASDFGWWTVPLTIITSYFMIGMETVAEHVEEPFGFDEDDLDLEGLCSTIERSVDEIFTRSGS